MNDIIRDGLALVGAGCIGFSLLFVAWAFATASRHTGQERTAPLRHEPSDELAAEFDAVAEKAANADREAG